MNKTATIENDILTESISNTWPPYYYELAQQLDECCDRHNFCLNCPVRFKCESLWNSISDSKKQLTMQDYKDYSKQIADLRARDIKRMVLK
jgi:hypothetical protein